MGGVRGGFTMAMSAERVRQGRVQAGERGSQDRRGVRAMAGSGSRWRAGTGRVGRNTGTSYGTDT